MKVIEYIKTNGLESLAEFGISVKKYPEGLIVLNYDQIESPKTNPLVVECRSLIIDEDFNIISRSFDRFFNYGEAEATFNPEGAVAYEKIDGSLIKIYNWKGVWYVSTRGTAFAESKVNGWDITFKEMVFKALNLTSEEGFQARCNDYLGKPSTYIFEVTGLENRVVTRYNGYTLWFLASRYNWCGDYKDVFLSMITEFGAKLPKKFKFSSVEGCIETAKHLTDLQEGYVMYENGIPVCKVKSPAYVAVHHIRGEGLNPKRIAELVVINEQDEYLKYFPEDSKHFTPHVEALIKSLTEAQEVYNVASSLESQKDFALAVKDYPWFAFAFQARKSGESNILKVFNSQETNYKVKFLLGLLNIKG